MWECDFKKVIFIVLFLVKTVCLLVLIEIYCKSSEKLTISNSYVLMNIIHNSVVNQRNSTSGIKMVERPYIKKKRYV